MSQSDLFGFQPPPPCSHVPVLTRTPELVHYGREDCEKCGKFIRWVPFPADAIRKNTKPNDIHTPEDR